MPTCAPGRTGSSPAASPWAAESPPTWLAKETGAGEQNLAGLVFLGYPLHAPNRHDRLRADNLMKITAPMLFVEGTNDPFCRMDLLTEVLEQVKAPTQTHLIEGGNHDFRVPKRQGRTAEAIWQEVVETICRWRTGRDASRS